jgi:hypothetical protein
MPRPLSSFKPVGAVLLGNTTTIFAGDVGLELCNSGRYPLEARPQFLVLAMRIISASSILDLYVSRCLAKIVGAHADVATSMYNALGSTATQHAALRAAGKAVLDEEELAMFESLISTHYKVVKNRHKVAHHLWGLSSAAPDGIILLDPRRYESITKDPENIKYEEISVYDENDFKDWLSGIEQLATLFARFESIAGCRREAIAVQPHPRDDEPTRQKFLALRLEGCQNSRAAFAAQLAALQPAAQGKK